MACYAPLTAWRSNTDFKTMVFKESSGLPGTETRIACGQCIGCRLEYSRRWAIRCTCEAKMHIHNTFSTLTYDDDNLPYTLDGHPTLCPRDLTLFLKKLRKKYADIVIRYYAAGEYGERTARPHYHLLLFGFWPPDAYIFDTRSGVELLRSPEFDALWTHGVCTHGKLCFDSAAYVTRYVTKKQIGVKSDDHYMGRVREFCRMSRRPGIGKSFYNHYRSDIFTDGPFVSPDGHISGPVPYFDQLYKADFPALYEDVKQKRTDYAKAHELPQKRLEQLDQFHRVKGKIYVREPVKEYPGEHK